MEESVVEKALYQKYIVPTKKEREKFIGIEIEMPIINMDCEAVDFAVVHKLTAAFAEHFHMEKAGTDDEGNVYSLTDPITEDNMSYDCSYNNLELSMGKERNLNVLNQRFQAYYTFIEEFLKPYRHTLTGLGINPYRNKNKCVPIPSERYRMLFAYLGSYKEYKHPDYFHPYPDFGTFSSASQVQLDVKYDDLVDTVNIFTKLEPIKALLFSNSVMPESEAGMLCVRDMLWENSMHGLNPKNVGVFDCEFTSVEDLFEYIKQTSIYCTMRDGKYIHFTPVPVLEYFKCKNVSGVFWNGMDFERTSIEPVLEDLKYLRTFKFVDLTFRGTIEFRSCCCQPITDRMSVAAFHTGLCESLGKLKLLLDSDCVLYGHGMNISELRKAFCRGQIPPFIDEKALQNLLISVLELAHTGLEKRNFGENRFLAPLYERAVRRTNPAREYLDRLNKGITVNDLVSQYAQI